MKPYYEADGIAIYHGDCREVVPSLELHAAALVTDPMYGISSADISRKHGHTLKQDFFADDRIGAAREHVAVGLTALGPDAGAFVFCGHRQFGAVEDLLEESGFKTGPFAWVKTNPAPSVRKAGWRSSIELAVWGVRGAGFHWRDQASALNRWIGPACVHGHPEKNGHPTQKPTGVLIAAVAQLSGPGDTVLDVAMGSGTTLVVARNSGRRAVGIEIEERFCEVAAERLSQSQLDLGASV